MSCSTARASPTRACLRSIAGTNGISGTVTLNGTNNIGVDAGQLNLTGVVSGSGVTLNKVGGGILELGGTAANTFTGTVNIVDGTLQLNKTAAIDAIPTGVTVNIGDNVGSADALKLIAANQINDAATINVLGSGTLNLNGQAETINTTLGLVSGLTGAATVTTGAGTLTAGGNITETLQSGTLGNTTAPSITGTVAMAAVRTVTLADSIGTVDISIPAAISGAGGITTAGAGRLDLSSATSSYTGANTVASGTIVRVSGGGDGCGRSAGHQRRGYDRCLRRLAGNQ